MNDYRGPIVTVDAVVVRNNEGTLEFFIHERPREPFAGISAIPGAYMREGETIHATVSRILREKANLSHARYLTTVNIADSIARDPRGHALSIVTLSFVTMSNSELTDAGKWVSLAELENTTLAFDHADIIKTVHQHIKRYILVDPNILKGLTMDRTPLSTSSIVSAFRAIGDEDGVSNIRRRVRVSGIAQETDTTVESEGRGRPSKKWEFAV